MANIDVIGGPRAALLARFPHPFTGAYDRAMSYLSMSLGLSGPMVRMLPLGGAVLRRHCGEPDAPSPEAVDAAELAQLRALLAHVTSEDVPGPEPSVVYR